MKKWKARAKDLERSLSELRDESIWIRRKLGLPDDAPFVDANGDSVAGRMRDLLRRDGETVDIGDSKSPDLTSREGSTPSPGTISKAFTYQV